jgi:translation elongation factor EF-1alpha
MKILIVGFVALATLDIADGGILTRYRHPKELDEQKDNDLFYDVVDMLQKNERVRVYTDNKELSPFVEIVDSQGDEIQIITGNYYVENIVNIVQDEIDEGDIIIDIDNPEITVDSKYLEDIFFLREQPEYRTKDYEDGMRLEVNNHKANLSKGFIKQSNTCKGA